MLFMAAFIPPNTLDVRFVSRFSNRVGPEKMGECDKQRCYESDESGKEGWLGWEHLFWIHLHDY